MSKGRKLDEGETSLNVLLKQYEFLRNEITQAIYLKHAAVLGLYTFLGFIFAILVKQIWENDFELPSSIYNLDLGTAIIFLLTLVMVQVIICGFGSLFLKEQARDRRTCSFLRAIEYLINEKIGETGIYWENYIALKFVKEKLSLKNFFGSSISPNLEYLKNSFLGIGLPVFLPNLLMTSVLYALCIFCRKGVGFFSILLVFFVTSSLVTFLWAFMIMSKTWKRSEEESGPRMEDALEWLRREKSKPLLRSAFTIENEFHHDLL